MNSCFTNATPTETPCVQASHMFPFPPLQKNLYMEEKTSKPLRRKFIMIIYISKPKSHSVFDDAVVHNTKTEEDYSKFNSRSVIDDSISYIVANDELNYFRGRVNLRLSKRGKDGGQHAAYSS